MFYIPKPIYKKRRSRFFKYFYHKNHFRTFYGSIKLKHLEKVVKKSTNKKNRVSFFIYLMELRLDVLLYRLNFVNSIRESRQLVLHGLVVINKKIIRNPSYVLKLNDLLSFKKTYIYTFKKKLYKNIKSQNFLISSIPNYIEYSLKTLKFKFILFNIRDLPKVAKLNRNSYSNFLGL